MKRLSSTVVTDYQKPIKSKHFSPSPIKRYSQKQQFSSDNKENIGSCQRMLFQAKFKRPLAPSKRKLLNQNISKQEQSEEDQSFIIPLKTSSLQNIVRFDNQSEASAQKYLISEGQTQIILNIDDQKQQNEQLILNKNVTKNKRDKKVQKKDNSKFKKFKMAISFEEEKLKQSQNLEKEEEDTNIIQNFNLENQELSSISSNDIQNQLKAKNTILQFTSQMSQKEDKSKPFSSQLQNSDPLLFQGFSQSFAPSQPMQSGQNPQNMSCSSSQQDHNDHQQSQQQSMLMNGVQFQGRWTAEEHLKFIEGLNLFGKDWRKIEEHIGSRTCAQIRSHAQKYFNRVTREIGKDYMPGQNDESKEQSESHNQMEIQSEGSNTNKNQQMVQSQNTQIINSASPKQQYLQEQEKIMIQTNKQLMQIEERFSKIQEEDLQIKLNNLLLEREMISKFLIKKKISAQEACEKLIEVTQKLHQLGLQAYVNNKCKLYLFFLHSLIFSISHSGYLQAFGR